MADQETTMRHYQATLESLREALIFMNAVAPVMERKGVFCYTNMARKMEKVLADVEN